MSASGETIATAVATTTRSRKGDRIGPPMLRPSAFARRRQGPRLPLLGPHGLLPLVEELEPLPLVERLEDVRSHRDRLQHLPELLLQRRGRRLSMDVVADGAESGLRHQ